MFHSPGVHVVAFVPVAGPVPPPISVVSPALIASPTSWGQMKWMCVSSPPAVTIFPSPAMTSVDAPITMPGVTPGHQVGIARLADGDDAAVADADVGLHDAPVVDDDARW